MTRPMNSPEAGETPEKGLALDAGEVGGGNQGQERAPRLSSWQRLTPALEELNDTHNPNKRLQRNQRGLRTHQPAGG